MTNSTLAVAPALFRNVLAGDLAISVSETHPLDCETVVFLNTSDVLHGRFLHSSRSAVKSLPGQAKKSIQANDILFSEIRPANGRWALVKGDVQDYVVSTKLMVIRVNPNVVLADYLYLWLTSQSTTAQLQHLAESRSGTFPQITFDDLRTLPVSLPSLGEQHRITAFFNTLADLIDACERIQSNAEELGHALTRRKLADGFETVNTGTVAPGWQLSTVGECVSVIETGKRPVGGVAGINGGVPSIGAESIDGIGRFDFSKTKFVPIEFAESMRRGHATDRDVLVYKDGGKPGEFRPHVGMFGGGFPFDVFTINEHVFRVRTDERTSQEFLYFWLSSDLLMARMANAGTGAAIPGLNKTAFKSLPMVIPPRDVREDLFPALSQLVRTALEMALESSQLRRTRDELLPLLMSGKVRVSDLSEVGVQGEE